jgi:hypothetical protein
MHWTQEEEKKRGRRKLWTLIFSLFIGLFFGVWQGSAPAGLTAGALVVAFGFWAFGII